MGDFQGKSYVCLKEYYPKGYNFAGGQLTSASVHDSTGDNYDNNGR